MNKQSVSKGRVVDVEGGFSLRLSTWWDHDYREENVSKVQKQTKNNNRKLTFKYNK